MSHERRFAVIAVATSAPGLPSLALDTQTLAYVIEIGSLGMDQVLPRLPTSDSCYARAALRHGSGMDLIGPLLSLANKEPTP